MNTKTQYIITGPNHVKKIVKIDPNTKPVTQSDLDEIQKQLADLANIKYPCSSAE